MSPRDRRLQQDNKQLHALVTGDHSLIRIKSEEGIPPDKYVIAYHVMGLHLDHQDNVLERDYHEMEVYLPLDYPRGQPQLKMLTPIFHPNIDPSHVCQGDFWGAEERLEDLIVRIAELITYQDYNLKSPLDGRAAEYTEMNRNAGLFPVDNRELRPASGSTGEAAEELAKISFGSEDDFGVRFLDSNEATTVSSPVPDRDEETSSAGDLGIRILGDWEEEEQSEAASSAEAEDLSHSETEVGNEPDEDHDPETRQKLEMLESENARLKAQLDQESSGSGKPDVEIFLADDEGNSQGPFSLREVCMKIGSGDTELDDYAYVDGLDDWITLRQVFSDRI